MKKFENNKMAMYPINKLFWVMGLPMVISMVLQALYNVVDSIFVTNIKEIGGFANEALTLAFPIQILIIAIGVGTGVGLNTLLSKSLGEKNSERVNKIAGTGIFLSIIIYIIFLIFGIFGSYWFISLFSSNKMVIEMGTSYLRICTCLSFGSIAYTIYERLLQATGKTMYSTIAQISGAVTNIILDYVFIFPLNMSVTGAALATVIGQFVSLFIAMYFHYFKNMEISNSFKYIRYDRKLIKAIYQIELSATLMQALLSVMMAGMNAILGTSNVSSTILVGSFGIYYKIQQIALFSAFGLSNTIISILSFNYGMQDKERIDDCIKYGIIDSIIVTLIITIIFEILKNSLVGLFSLGTTTTKEITSVCKTAITIASLGYVFMGVSVAIQGVLQSLRYAFRPLLISLFRLVIFVFPLAYFFIDYTKNVTTTIWWTFPIAEILTAFISIFLLKKSYKEKIAIIDNKQIIKDNNLIITISREHGTNGKRIAQEVASKLNISFYDKEQIKEFASKYNIEDKSYSDDELYNYYSSLDVNKENIIKQANTIKKIADKSDCVIVGRAADYILKDYKKIIKIFLYAPIDYRVKNIMHNYNDSKEEALNNIKKSDKSRSSYYEVISNNKWKDIDNYDLCINCCVGNDKVIETIIKYINNK